MAQPPPLPSPSQLSFLPDDYLVRRAQHRTNLLCASLFVVMIGAVAIAFAISDSTMRDAESRHAAVDAQYADAANRIKQLQQMQDKQRVLTRHAALSSSLIDRVPRSYMLARITNLLPQGVSLTDLEMSTKKRTTSQAEVKTTFEKKKPVRGAKGKGAAENLPPLPDPQDVSLKLSGRATTNAEVAQFMTKLKESELFSNVDLLISAQFEQRAQEGVDTGLRRFTIDITVNPKADVRPAAAVAAPTTKPSAATEASVSVDTKVQQ